MKVIQQLAPTFFFLLAIVVSAASASDDTTTSTSFLRHRMLPPDCSTVRCAAGCSIETPCAKDETCVPCDSPYTGCTAQCTVANLDCGGYYKCEAATTEPTTTTTTATTTANAGVTEGDCLLMNTECGGNTGNDCSDCCSNAYINTKGTKTCVDQTIFNR